MANRSRSRTNAADGVQGGMRVQPEHAEESTRRARAKASRLASNDETVEVAAFPHQVDDEIGHAVVEHGHCVHAPIPGKFTMHYSNGLEAKVPVCRAYGPGEEVHLPMSEIKRLRVLGHLVDPDRKVKRPPQAPRMVEKGNTEGARVRT